MQCKFNKFTKKQDSKTAFVLTEGKAIFSETVYILQPIYIHKRSPDYTLVCKSKHVSGLFKIAANVYLGDYRKNALIVFIRPESQMLDIFMTDLRPMEARQLLLDGLLNDELYKARVEALVA